MVFRSVDYSAARIEVAILYHIRKEIVFLGQLYVNEKCYQIKMIMTELVVPCIEVQSRTGFGSCDNLGNLSAPM